METYGYGLIPTCPLKEPLRLRLFFCTPFFPLLHPFSFALPVPCVFIRLPVYYQSPFVSIHYSCFYPHF